MNTTPCCAHLKVVYRRQERRAMVETLPGHSSMQTLYSDRWECPDCGCRFVPQSDLYPPTPCCGYRCSVMHPYVIMWNPHNSVVQCHHCGQVFVPDPKKTTQFISTPSGSEDPLSKF